ncbi:class I SAM-dependent methyltransferase [Streptomyces cyaneus]|uniref:class I SAM-dependent methyltransferase n=1 Tax=Streptomyces cyaneus TaxID=1904 RepID=UPI000FF8A087|nr:class I SAM-dependent methyltransferase [Streptomyces cyaneus]
MTRVARARWEEHFARGRGFRGVKERELRLLGEAVRPRTGARALDVGCGLGTYAAALAGLGYDTLAVDWADAAVAAARDRYADLEPRLRVRRLDFEDATEVAARLPRAGFDLVTMRLVLAFMTDKRAIAQRVRGLLAPGGTWVVTTPLAGRLPLERQYIGVTAQDVAAVTEGWGRGEWYDLDAGGVRCFVLRS